MYHEIKKGFEEQWDRANEQMDFWEIYNCKLGAHQYYSGNSKIFLPIVHNAVNARRTRFVNQIFPVSGRNVEVTTQNSDIPHAEMALAEHYIRRAKLRTEIVPALMINGDVEGHYNLYVSWQKDRRYVTWRTPDPVNELEVLADEENAEPYQHEEFDDAGPHVEVLSDGDVLVLPHTADSIQTALRMGGSVTVLRRWSKAKIKEEIADGDIDEEKGEALLEEMTAEKAITPDKAKDMVSAAGIKTQAGGSKFALVYETWTLLTIDGERRLCLVKYGGEKIVLSAKRNPYWNDRCPVISAPVDKLQGAFKGISKVKPCAEAQYYANDAVNEAADSSLFALMPIVMTDPNRNPLVGSMVLSLAAVWQVDPKSTQFAQFPELWKQGFDIVGACKAEIAQALSVSPAAITMGGATKQKQSQADVAREQQIDILTTADAVTVIENAILSPLVNWFVELDHQFREDDLMVPEFGELGRKAQMEIIPPIQMGKAYHFRWFGVEAARTAQQIQQQIAMVNVLRGIPPQQYEGRRLNLVPVISQLVENTFGPRLAPLVFEDTASQMPVPIDMENQLLANGFQLAVHPQDDDQQHIQMHGQLLQMEGMGNANKIRTHIFEHVQAVQRKQVQQQQAMMAAQQPGLVGAPGGAGPGIAGTPRPGAMPGQPRFQQHSGHPHIDQIGPMSGGPPRLRNGGV